MLPILPDIAPLLSQKYNIDVSMYDPAFLSKTIFARINASGSSSEQAYKKLISENNEEGESLISCLSNSYSEFFRDPLLFSYLSSVVLPILINRLQGKSFRELRIWIPGCAAGQEPFSIAMILLDLTAQSPCSFRIFATDRLSSEVAKAKKGIFDTDLVGNIPQKYLRRFFSRHQTSYQTLPELQSAVDFSDHDLLSETQISPSESIFGGFDLILCCNILFYYRPSVRKGIIDNLVKALAHGGYLATDAPSANLLAHDRRFEPVLSEAGLFRKKTQGTP